MKPSLLERAVAPLVELRTGEGRTALLMFAYAYLGMLAYNIAQPLIQSEAIEALGAVNVPYLDLGVGLLIGLLMLGYMRLFGALPHRWALPIILLGMAGLMVAFWLAFQIGGVWVPVAFYFWGSLLGILIISQFWTLANGIYEPRQAKRLFGFLGGGVTLGGASGAFTTAWLVERVGTNTLVLASAVTLAVCAGVVAIVAARESATAQLPSGAPQERGIGFGRAFTLLRESRQVQVIAVVIALGAISARIIAQQLNMTAELLNQGDAIGAFLAYVRGYMSLAAFVLQVWVTPRVHRYLGVGFALLMLPAGLTVMAAGIIATQLLQAPGVVTVFDRSLRYTVDKTTREVLFMPLPSALRQDVKPFIDVTVDRVSKGVSALLVLVLIQPWGFALDWWQLSWASLVLMGIWGLVAIRAKRGYRTALRQSLERHDLRPSELRLDVADLATIETLMQELASPNPDRVLYAIDILEALDKRNLVTPLLLHHEVPAVRARALQALGAMPAAVATQWLPSIERLVADSDARVRAAAVSALARIQDRGVAELVRPYVEDPDPRVATTAAIVLARDGDETDAREAERVLSRLISGRGETAPLARREVAAALGGLPGSTFQPMLVPLLHDPDPEVSAEAMRSVRRAGSADPLVVPALVSLLRHRELKGAARETLVGYGEPVLETLAYVLRDRDENLWIRRHLPATIARIPSPRSVEILLEALSDSDGFLRYKAIQGLIRLRRDHPELPVAKTQVETLAAREARRYFNYLTLHHNLFERAGLSREALLEPALREKMARTVDRIYLLLGLIYSWQDIAAARYTIQHGHPRSRASAVEYLDNTLTGSLRKQVMPLLDDAPLEERVRRANLALKTRPRDVEETLLRLINDDDQVVTCAAIDLVEALGVWALAGDLEHVLAHRPAEDFAVFEAASWALAAHRMPETRRRSLWLEALPAVQVAARLRRVPMFATVSVDELFRIAGAGQQTRQERGRLLCEEGVVPDRLQVLLDGPACVLHGQQEGPPVTPPAALGLHEILGGSPLRQTVRTTDRAVCLILDASQLRTMIADSTHLVQGLFRTLVDESNLGKRPVVTRSATPGTVPVRPDELQPIDKLLALQAVPGFGEITAEGMTHVAAIAREVPLEAAATLFDASAAPALWTVLSGSLSLTAPDDGPGITVNAGDVIGVYETLAGRGLDRTATVAGAGRALRIDHDDLFDLLGQHPHLLQRLFAALLGGSDEATIGPGA